eukprot:CAMPEP_0203746468 /NCGR_PEP_ID=MMETSP0098-20131031/1911_1 /ASSEMBLY_ACC=CAM_ASM_000208 /TAXON_ID=96639 /ORGANISM=" , Strain NY0313808BC1" /LENGTH=1089 /DNA_ID=CAMNT_0050634593 /DNA_START=2943 /DNA_END=6208 /DNA_ORIENTATION=+
MDVWAQDQYGQWHICSLDAASLEDAPDVVEVTGGTIGKVRVKKGKLCGFNKGVAADITSLRHINEPCILYNLEKRSLANKPYTFLGTVLISVNPLMDVGDPAAVGSPIAANNPHPYAIAERAYKQMAVALRRQNLMAEHVQDPDTCVDQSILISGESGSGKSEGCKRVIQHLVARSTAETKVSCGSLEDSILKATQVLESFGNAYTLSNHNSSRFGKLCKLYFEGKKISVAHIEPYLLERSRVTSHRNGERNFHIFYRILAGISASERRAFGIFNHEIPCDGDRSGRLQKTFRILDSTIAGNTFQRDAKEYHVLRDGLAAIGFDKALSHRLMGVMVALLHLGNLCFQDSPTSSSSLSSLIIGDFPESRVNHLEWAASLLGLTEDALRNILCERKLKVGAETISVALSADQAMQTRDGILRALYDSIFTWVIKMANANFGDHTKEGTASIGVLDIFGFESFEENSLEQLLINFTNEALQKTFEDQILVAEANLYKDEGLLLVDMQDQVSSERNGADTCIELLEGRAGVIMTIEDLSRTPSPSDSKLLQYLHKNFTCREMYQKPNPRRANSEFIITHYAGDVTYQVNSFVEKNVDRIAPELMQTFRGSDDKDIVSRLFSDTVPTGARGRKTNPRGICGKFTLEIKRLVSDLEQTSCSFIRCIKPNVQMKRKSKGNAWFDRKYILPQMRHLSIAQTAQILKSSGLPTRIPYEEIFGMFEKVLPEAIISQWKRQEEHDLRSFTKALFWAIGLDATCCRFGLTRVFFSKDSFDEVELVLSSSAVFDSRIHKRFITYLQKVRWRRCFVKVLSVKRFECMLIKSRTRRNAAKVMIRFLARAAEQMKRRKQAAIVIQRMCARKFNITKTSKAVKTLQAFIRTYFAKKKNTRLKLEKLQRPEKTVCNTQVSPKSTGKGSTHSVQLASTSKMTQSSELRELKEQLKLQQQKINELELQTDLRKHLEQQQTRISELEQELRMLTSRLGSFSSEETRSLSTGKCPCSAGDVCTNTEVERVGRMYSSTSMSLPEEKKGKQAWKSVSNMRTRGSTCSTICTVESAGSVSSQEKCFKTVSSPNSSFAEYFEADKWERWFVGCLG